MGWGRIRVRVEDLAQEELCEWQDGGVCRRAQLTFSNGQRMNLSAGEFADYEGEEVSLVVRDWFSNLEDMRDITRVSFQEMDYNQTEVPVEVTEYEVI